MTELSTESELAIVVKLDELATYQSKERHTRYRVNSC